MHVLSALPCLVGMLRGGCWSSSESMHDTHRVRFPVLSDTTVLRGGCW